MNQPGIELDWAMGQALPWPCRQTCPAGLPALAQATLFLTAGSSSGYGFGIAAPLGIMGGAFVSAVATRSFHMVIPEALHLKHLLVNGGLMGIGASCAGGCNIGIVLTGMSTSSVRALTALAAIVVGMLPGIALLMRTETVDEPRYHRHHAGHHAGV